MTHKLIALALVFITIGGLPLLNGCKKKTAEEKGKETADEKAGYIKGVGDSLQGKGKEAAQSIGGGIVRVWSGLNEGIEGKAASAVNISPELEALGTKVTRAQLNGSGVVNAYVIVRDPLKATFCMKALDKDGVEIGRASVDVDFSANSAAYVDFKFDARTPMALVNSLELTSRKQSEDQKPNQSVQPSPTTVTPPAGQESRQP